MLAGIKGKKKRNICHICHEESNIYCTYMSFNMCDVQKCSVREVKLKNFWPCLHFITCKKQNSKSFLVSLGVIKWKHWPEIPSVSVLKLLDVTFPWKFLKICFCGSVNINEMLGSFSYNTKISANNLLFHKSLIDIS